MPMDMDDHGQFDESPSKPLKHIWTKQRYTHNIVISTSSSASCSKHMLFVHVCHLIMDKNGWNDQWSIYEIYHVFLMGFPALSHGESPKNVGSFPRQILSLTCWSFWVLWLYGINHAGTDQSPHTDLEADIKPGRWYTHTSEKTMSQLGFSQLNVIIKTVPVTTKQIDMSKLGRVCAKWMKSPCWFCLVWWFQPVWKILVNRDDYSQYMET